MFGLIFTWIRWLLRLEVASRGPKRGEISLHAPLCDLPLEILQLITAFLPITSAASFALCSRFTYSAIGSQDWHLLRDPAYGTAKRQFLAILERDLPNFVYCNRCNLLHRRMEHESPRRPSGWAGLLNHSVKRCIRRDRIRFLWVRNYNLYFQLCQLVMRAYRYGPQYGIPLGALTHMYSESRERSALQVFISARIAPATDELILRIKFRVLIQCAEDLADLKRHGVHICPHLVGYEIYSRLPALLRCKLSHVKDLTCPACSRLIQCNHCATECLVETEDFGDLGLVVTITGWKNLGSCKTPTDRMWKDQAYDLYVCSPETEPVYRTYPGSIYASFEDPGSLIANSKGTGIYRHVFCQKVR